MLTVLDFDTLDHLHRWCRREYLAHHVGAVYHHMASYLEALPEDDVRAYLDKGWPVVARDADVGALLTNLDEKSESER